MSDRVGQQVGNYRLALLLGQGGFADVYLGEHLYLNTRAAIKVLQTRLSNDDMTDFQHEARTIANLVHPNIVRVLDFGVDNATPYLVMDYAPNGTLRQFFPKNEPLSPRRILPYIQHVASALMYAHEQKIVHRDVKPENMLLGPKNDVLLSDFGIATASQSSRFDGSGQVVGTASYMAPEQIQGRPVTASDQYALAIVVYEWLSGERPFRGTFTEVTSQQMFAAPAPLRERIPALSPEIEQVVMIALAKDPQRRFATVEAFAHAYEQAVQENTSPSPFISYPTVAALEEPTVLSHPPAAPIFTPQQTPNMTPSRPVTNYGETPVLPLITPPAAHPQDNKGVSRRAFVLGMSGIAALVVVGGAFMWWEGTHNAAPQSPASQTTSTIEATSQPTSAPTQQQPGPTSAPGPVIGTTISTYTGHRDRVVADVWSPDGGLVATCSYDKTVQVWNAKNGANFSTYRGHADLVWSVDWQPGGRWIASGGNDKTVQIWDAQSTSTHLTYTGHSNFVYTVAWSPDGTRIASGGEDHTVRVWDATNGQTIMVYRNHTGPIHLVSWSPDGRSIVSASDDMTAQVWDASSGQTYVTYTGHSAKVTSVDWSHNGQYIVSGSWDKTAQAWDATNGNQLRTYSGHTDHVWSAAWSPDDAKIASSGKDGTVQIWDATTAGWMFSYNGRGDGATLWQAQWSPDGQMIASADDDGTAQVWQAV